MADEDEQSDSEWLRLQRLESDRRRWLWSRLKSLAGWVGGALTFLWAGIDAAGKLIDWVVRK
jgi:hypothetical protein